MNYLGEVLEELVSWLKASPKNRNKADFVGINRFHETGPKLIDAVYGAIGCGQHVALAGPRGCGKSFCIDRAIRDAERDGLIPSGGWIKIQGNKELPRDYLIEDDLTLYSDDSGVVIPKRKDAPLFRFCRRSQEPDSLGKPVLMDDTEMSLRLDRPMMPEDPRIVECYGLANDGSIDLAKLILPHQRIVLFLDEVNRFSDGVLDSLLLLLEEGEAVMGGDLFRLPVVVMMTMNPPGYDASARTLSPPLSARIGRQYRLISPRLDVLTDIILPDAIESAFRAHSINPRSDKVELSFPNTSLVRRAAAVTLCAWGDPRSGSPGFDYLSDETKSLLMSLADTSSKLKEMMQSLNELCHFGPDGRALGDWLKAASVAAISQATALGKKQAEIQNEHFIQTAITTLSHKLQDNFSAASRPDNTRRKEEALYGLADILMRSSDTQIESLLMRSIDSETKLTCVFKNWLPQLEATKIRSGFLDAGLTDESEFDNWVKLINKLNSVTSAEFDESIRDYMVAEGILENDGHTLWVTSNSNMDVIKWFSIQLENLGPDIYGKEEALLREFRKIQDELRSYDRSRKSVVEHFAFFRARLWGDSQDGIHKLLVQHQLDKLPRAGIVQLFEAIDAIWIQAEHVGASSAERLWSLLDMPLVRTTDDGNIEVIQDSTIPATFRIPSAQFALQTVKLMANHVDRGGGTRSARRKVEKLYHKVSESHSDTNTPA